MIDFAELVSEQLFVEAITDSPFETFYTDNASLAKTRKFLNNTFGIDPWPDYTGISGIAKNAYLRQTVEDLIPFTKVFPLLDFLWYIIQNAKNDADILINNTKILKVSDMDTWDTNFEQKCSQKNQGGSGSNPVFGYVPVSSKAIQLLPVLQRKLTQTLIGELVLTSPDFQNLSIKQTLYKLLEIRKKVRQSTLKTNIPSSIKEVDNLLLKPNTQVLNEFPQKFKGIYDRVSAETLYDIVIAIHRFFKAEANRFGIKDQELGTSIENFLDNEPLDPSSKNFNFFNKTTSTNIVAEPEPGPGGYILKNIREINTNQAENLVKKLESFANYIKEGEPSNLAATLGGVAGALKSFSGALGPTMGKR